MITHVVFQVVLYAGMLILLLLFLKMHHASRRESDALISHIEKTSTNRILQAEVNMQENTYREIAMDIHDHVSHTLALCRMQLEHVQQRKGSADASLEKTSELLSDAMMFLSGLSRRLNDHLLQSKTLPDAIRTAISFYPASLPISFAFTISGSHYSLGATKELHVYRIVQEALSNIITHSRATKATIHLAYSSTSFECSIRDNGIGFDEHSGKANGSGFSNMKRRAVLIGATLDISSIPFNGTLIRIFLPPLNQN